MIKILENENDRLKIEVDDLTLVNLLNEAVWNEKIDYAAYTVDHPYLSKPVLFVKSKDPKKTLLDAAATILKDITALRKEFQNVAKN